MGLCENLIRVPYFGVLIIDDDDGDGDDDYVFVEGDGDDCIWISAGRTGLVGLGIWGLHEMNPGSAQQSRF